MIKIFRHLFSYTNFHSRCRFAAFVCSSKAGFCVGGRGKDTGETLYIQPTPSAACLFNHVCAKNNDGKLNENNVEQFFFVFYVFRLQRE